jgi:hypothetical protein
MHRAYGRTALPHWTENVGAQRSAGVENYFTSQFFRADTRQFLGDIRDAAVRRGNQDDLRGKHLTREEGMRAARTDGPHGFARARLGAAYHSAYLPSQLAQPPS